eukprot:jgi/Galph1/3427/GphlegSOOS_G2108.1
MVSQQPQPKRKRRTSAKSSTKPVLGLSNVFRTFRYGSGSGEPPFENDAVNDLPDPNHSKVLLALPFEDLLKKLLKKEETVKEKPLEDDGLVSSGDEKDKKIRKIIIRDCTVLDREVVRRTVEPLYGKKLDSLLVKDVIATLNVWYEENGYKFSHIKRLGPFRNGVLTFQAIEPRFAGFELVYLDENRNPTKKGRTRSSTVEKAVGMRRGEVFCWKDHYWERITELGLFDYVRAELELRDDNSVLVVLRVRERPYSRFEPGIGYGSGEFFGELSFQDNNLFGCNQYLRVDLQKRQFQHSVMALEFEDPHIRPKLGYRFRIYRDVDEKDFGSRTGFVFKFISHLAKHVFVDVGATLERVQPLREATLPPFQMPSGPYGVDTNHLAVTSSSFVYDDRFPSTKNIRRGQRIFIQATYALPIRNDFCSFAKHSIHLAKYFPLPLNSTLAYGTCWRLGSSSLPEFEKHRLGGVGSIRGYSTGALGKVSSSLQQTVELRIPLFDNATGVVFRDQLDEVNDAKHWGLRRIGASKGIGLRIGNMIRLDYGWADSGSRLMHFGIVDPSF